MLKSKPRWVYLKIWEVLILIKATIAFDDLKNLGNRTIAFEDDSTFPTTTTIIAIPENRSSILYNGKVYDWYGREATLDRHIKRIIAPYGYASDHNARFYYSSDSFVAELKSGEYAFVGLEYQTHRKIYDPNYTGTKYAITGGYLNRAPYINFEEDNIIHDATLITSILKETDS